MLLTNHLLITSCQQCHEVKIRLKITFRKKKTFIYHIKFALNWYFWFIILFRIVLFLFYIRRETKAAKKRYVENERIKINLI